MNLSEQTLSMLGTGIWETLFMTFVSSFLAYVIGIPLGLQCFKFAGLAFFPFGKEVVYGGGAASLIVNIIWLIILGIPMAIAHATAGVILCVTIIGFPFGLQFFKLAKLSLMPFGARVI